MGALDSIVLRSGIFDSRDVDDRITEIEAVPEADRDEWDAEELAGLHAIREDVGNAGWQYGIGFIGEDVFGDYARETAISIGAIQEDAGWPVDYIDWEQAANALKSDYSNIVIDGTTYFYRAE